jgi:prepilin signal peptidase PulO-like enzyme (type II secretory pathway)
MGDAKVGFLLGFALGSRTLSAMFIAFFGLFLAALWTLSRHGLAARRQSLPFGPFLAFGTIVAFFLT